MVNLKKLRTTQMVIGMVVNVTGLVCLVSQLLGSR